MLYPLCKATFQMQIKKDDPIDRAVLKAYEESVISEDDKDYVQTEMIGFNPTMKRVVAEAGGVDEHECQWKVEGADKIESVEQIIASEDALSSAGYKTIAIAMCFGDARKEDHGPWQFVGIMPMLDPPREDTAATVIAFLHHANISVKMITGDHLNG